MTAPAARAPLQLAGRLLVLDEAFPPLDFAQDVKLAADGAAIVTRWSGVVHVASPDGHVRRLELREVFVERMVGQRRRLLDYLKGTKVERYRKVVKDLGLRR